MAGKQAKLLSPDDIRRMLQTVSTHRYPERDRVIVLLSTKTGLRAAEIAKLTWPMVLDADGRVGRVIALEDRIAKRGSGRSIPINGQLRRALVDLRFVTAKCDFHMTGPIVRSERLEGEYLCNTAMRAGSIVFWFRRLYQRLGLLGCSSHSGRRTFITRAARLVHKAGGSLRDVQQLAGHGSIEQTQSYIEGDSDSKRRLVALI